MQCRTCLRRPGALPLFGEAAGRRAHMLAAVLALPVTEDDQLPTHICTSCLSHLKIAYTFRQKCELSYKLLTSSINSENPDDLSILNVDDAETLYENIGSFDAFENDIQLAFDELKENSAAVEAPQPCQVQVLVEEKTSDEPAAIQTPPTDPKINKQRKKIRIDTRKHGYFIMANKDDVGLEPEYLEELYKIYKHHCNHCPRIYAVSSYFKVHVNSHLGIKPYFCEICQKNFHDERSHVKYHKQRKEKGTYQCQYCDRAYNCRGSLRTHMKIHTGDIKWFPCTHCSSKFNQLNKLKNHMVVHSTDRNFVCQYCSKAFRFDRNLKAHIRSVHVKVRPHICDICTKCFTTTHELKLHKRRHLGIKNYSCDLCLLQFVSSSEVRSHIQSVHNKDRNFACQNCGLRFSRSTQRNSHEQSKRCVINLSSSTLNISDSELAMAIEAGRFSDDFIPRRGAPKQELIDDDFVLDPSNFISVTMQNP